MFSGVKETSCTHCDHLKVCSLKEQFLKAQEAVDGVLVSLGDKRTKRLRDFDWINPVNLNCINFSERKPTPRESCCDSL